MTKTFWYARFAYNILRYWQAIAPPPDLIVVRSDGILTTYGEWNAQQKSSSSANSRASSASDHGPAIPEEPIFAIHASGYGDAAQEMMEDLDKQKRFVPWMGTL